MAILENELVADNYTANEHPSLFLDKTEIQRIVAEQNAKSGFVPDPTATAQRGRARMLAQGVRPEDRLGSAGIVAARDGN